MQDGGAIVTVYGKGGKTRAVRIEANTVAMLAELRGAVPADAPVFAWPRGRRDSPRDRMADRSRRSQARADREVVAPHFCRHSLATHALDGGAPFALVRDTLGHASIATTDRYLHARPGESSSRFLRA
jgi:site-specific recombinase XerC